MEQREIPLVAYRLLIRLISNLNYFIKRVTYKRPAKPYHLINVSPFEIKKAIENSRWVKMRLFYGSGFIKKGEWDKPKQDLQPKHQQLFEYFNKVFTEDIPAHNTVYFRNRKNRVQIAVKYIEKYGPIFEQFSNNLFKTPINLRDMSVEYYSVAIDEEGSFLFLTGKHRLALAKAAGMKEMPVNVAIRHHEWQKYRDQLYTNLKLGNISREDILEKGHPDLMDLLEE